MNSYEAMLSSDELSEYYNGNNLNQYIVAEDYKYRRDFYKIKNIRKI